VKVLQQKIDAVMAAEAACNRQRSGANDAWQHLKWEVKRSATPGRIVVSGLVLGFASGFTSARQTGAAGSSLLSGPIFSMLLETVVPGLLAGLTAAAAGVGEDEEDSDAEATQETADGDDADADADEPAAAADDDEPAVKPRARRRRVRAG